MYPLLNPKLKSLALIIFFAGLGVFTSNAAWIDRTDNGGTVTASTQIHELESKEMAFDNTTNTKWLTNGPTTGWIQFQFPNGTMYTITRYSITSADDTPSRDPRNWTLYGSNDGSNWDAVDTQNNQSWTDRFQRREFACTSPNAFNYYRLDITANNGSSDYTGFSEMELLGETLIASNVYPADNAKGIDNHDLTLRWNGSSEFSNTEYLIYLDESFLLVQNAHPSVLKTQLSGESYVVDRLNLFTTYYWRVDIVSNGNVYAGNIWQFQTLMPNISCLSLPADINFDCKVTLQDLVIMTEQWLSGSCTLGLCADLDDSSQVDLVDLAVVSKDWNQAAEKIALYEIMADNEYDNMAVAGTNIADNFGDYSDWIEIRNLGDTPQNLQGWFLTDDKDILNKWTFPDVTIDAKGYLIVFASERGISVPNQPLHTNFQLNNNGEYLALVRPDLAIAHEYDSRYPSLDINQTYGLTLLAGEEELIASLLGSPTPGWDNAEAVTAEEPECSQPSGSHVSSFDLEMSITDTNSEIHYTLDGSIPQVTSAIYTGPLRISETTQIRARVFHPVRLPGPVISRYYLFLASDLQTFTSNIPIVVIENFNSGSIPGSTYTAVELQPTAVAIFDVDAFSGRTSLTSEADLIARAGIKRRGRSSYDSDKRNYRLEFWDEKNWDKDRPFLSMPSNADWILLAPYHFDRAMIRNAFIHQLSNDAGQYAVRTRFVEIFVNENGGDLSYNDYRGVYVVMEKIKRGNKRVDVTRLDPSDIAPPDVTGGYIVSIDSLDPEDSGFDSDRGLPSDPSSHYTYVYPKEEEIQDAQSSYIKKYINDLENATYRSYFKNPVTGFRKYIDEDSFIDHNLLTMLAMNVDALRLSTYMHKERNEKLKIGPIWDFDRSMGSKDGRDSNPYAWTGTGDGTKYFNYDWWYRFFQDDDFRLHYADRWYQLREGAFSTTHIDAVIDSLAAQIDEAQVRNFDKWTSVAPGNWQDEVDHLKTWLQQRTGWVDTQMAIEFAPKPPLFNQDGGDVSTGFELTMTSLVGSTYSDVELVAESASVRAYVPVNNSLSLTWTTQSFTPTSNWTNGSTDIGVGYDIDSDYDALINTDMQSEIYNKSQSVLCRIEFDHDGSLVDGLYLHMKYDDGFVAYINGTQVCRSSNVTNDIPGQADAVSHESSSSFEVFDISSFSNKLNTGTNILAIHGINSSIRSADMLVLPLLIASVFQPASSVDDVWYTTDGSDPRLFGGVVKTGAFEYSNTGPVVLDKSITIKARSHDPLWSALNEATFSVGPIAENLRITEMMYNPVDPNTEFIELQNVGFETINLNLVHFTDGIEFTFGDYSLAAGDYAVLVKNQATFAGRYNTAGMNIVPGSFIGSLDNAGEEIVLRNAIGEEIHDFDYKDSWYELTDGMGFSLTIVNPYSANPDDWDIKSGWRASLYAGGTPGQMPETTLATDSIVINELLAHSHASDPDWIELHNTTGSSINIGGWFLSDNDSSDVNIKKFEIPQNTFIPANGFLIFIEDTSFGSISLPAEKGFGLSEAGETLYLYSGHSGEVTGYYQTQQKFNASETDISFGRYEKPELSGGYDFVRMLPTMGDVNNDPLSSDIVITEIYYNPSNGTDYEFVELYNRTGSAVLLMTEVTTEKTPGNFITENISWRLEGTGYEFPQNTTIGPYEYVIVAKDPTKYSSAYGPYDGKLANSGEEIELQIPGDQEYDKDRYWIPIEKIDYNNVVPWPVSANGDGDSLNRISINTYGRNYSNWKAATPTPGS